MGNLTFGIIKPDAVPANHTGSIIQRINDAGFKLRAMKTLHMSLRQAQGFYEVHRERPFFSGLHNSLSSYPCWGLVWKVNRKGCRDYVATDSAKADEETLAILGDSVGEKQCPVPSDEMRRLRCFFFSH